MLPTWTQVGPYRVLNLLASGGMGEVYRALREIPREPGFVALKVLRPELAGDPAVDAMFEAEGRLALKLRHENIVRTLEMGEDSGRRYIAMEYVPGLDAAELLCRHRRSQRAPLPVSLAAVIVSEALFGLDYAHRPSLWDGRTYGLVHRDISTNNILVSREGQVKLADFGIAQSALRARSFARTLKGKLVYMSPEQALAKPLCQRSDIYSMGVVLYELLTGRRPFEGEGSAVIVDIDAGRFFRPRVFQPLLPQALEDVIMCAMAREPRDRFASAADMAVALGDVVSLERPHDVLAQLPADLFSTRERESAPPGTVRARRRARVPIHVQAG